MKVRSLRPADLQPALARLWACSGPKIVSIDRTCPPGQSAPVFTVRGRYTAKGWTEWTQGFQYGSALLQYAATGDEAFLAMGRDRTREAMAAHVTHFGVHDHGFNNVSTYGQLRRLALEGRFDDDAGTRAWLELALKASGAVQARRWTELPEGAGYIYSFNGPHSLFADTIRSLRALALAHRLGHTMMGENDRRISLLERLVRHAHATIRYNVYFGTGRDAYDVRGRVAHESIFNLNDGAYRCPSSQQGYSPFTTWTRGLAWVLTGCAEQLEFLETLEDGELADLGGREAVEAPLRAAALATADFYIEHTSTDGIPCWDTGAPGLAALGDWRAGPADPFNAHEPVDSSAAAIAVTGLLRLGRHLARRGEPEAGLRFEQAGLTVLATLLDPPYLGEDPDHQGLLLHSIYHRPNGWDYIPEGRAIPCGEASMWGDYHLREAALYVQDLAAGQPAPTFWGREPDARAKEDPS